MRKFRKTKKIILFSFVTTLAISGAAIVPIVMYNTNQKDYIDRSENNIQENIPIIPSEEIDVSLPENLSRLKLMFIEEINNLFNKEKINFLSANEVYKNNYKKSLDLLFDEITKSDAFSKLNNLNDNLAIISNFKKIVHESFDYLPIIFSEKCNWDFDFSSLVFDNSISLSQFKLITNTFNDMLSIKKHEQYFLNELSLLNKNEKFIWLLEQTNTTDEELKIFAKWYAENEVNEYKQDIKIYQNLLVEKLLDYESTFPKKYSKLLFENYKNDFINYVYNVVYKRIISDNSIESEYLLENIIHDLKSNSNSENQDKNELWDKFLNLLKTLIVFKNFIENVKKEDENLESDIKEFINSKYIQIFIEEDVFNSIKMIVDSNKNTNTLDILNAIKHIIVRLTGRPINSIKSLIATFYSINLDKIRNILKRIHLLIVNTYKDLSWEPNDKCLKSIETIIDWIDISYKIADSAWLLSSSPINFVTLPLKGFLGFLLIGENYNGNDFWNQANIIFFGVLTQIYDIVLSPIYGTVELIIFCTENNISFWQWMNAHWKCVQENWATFFDPLNWFHSCIKHLAKEIKYNEEKR